MKGTAVAQRLKRWPFTQWACIRFLVPRMIGLYIRFLMALMCLQKSLVASGRTSSKIAPVCQKAPLLPAFEREVHNVKRLHFFLMVDWLYTHLHSAVCSVYIVAAKEVRNMQSWKMTEQSKLQGWKNRTGLQKVVFCPDDGFLYSPSFLHPCNFFRYFSFLFYPFPPDSFSLKTFCALYDLYVSESMLFYEWSCWYDDWLAVTDD